MAPSNARKRQLQKLAERRAAERRRARRRRVLTIAVALIVGLGGSALAFIAFTGDDPTGPVAGPSPTPDVSPTAQPNPPAQAAPKTVACGAKKPKAAGKEKPTWASPPEMAIDPAKTYTATLKTSCGTIVIDLFAEESPKTVNNFVFLAREKFYDGTYFHRVIKDFMNQGGDPTGTGSGGPGYQFEDETANGLTFDEVGLLAMANSGPNTNGSQFFITTSEPTHLDGKHTIFGVVTKGYDVVKRINGLQTSPDDRPAAAVYVESVTIAEK